MTPKPSDAALSRLQKFQADVMDDKCVIYRVGVGSGTYGNTVETRTVYLSGTACGIQFTNGQIRQGNQVLVVDYDAVLRLPANQIVLLSDDIELIEKGETMISGTFQPASQPVVNSTVQHIPLKRTVS